MFLYLLKIWPNEIIFPLFLTCIYEIYYNLHGKALTWYIKDTVQLRN